MNVVVGPSRPPPAPPGPSCVMLTFGKMENGIFREMISPGEYQALGIRRHINKEEGYTQSYAVSCIKLIRHWLDYVRPSEIFAFTNT